MPDVIIVGAGRTGSALANACRAAGRQVVLVDSQPTSTESENVMRGRGFVAGKHAVAVLDERTGDESQVLNADHIVIATGRDGSVAHTLFLGLSKLGVNLDDSGCIVVDDRGRSSCPTIFAFGSCCTRPDLNVAEVAQGLAALLETQQPAEIAR